MKVSEKSTNSDLAILAADIAKKIEQESGDNDWIAILSIVANLLFRRQIRLVFDTV